MYQLPTYTEKDQERVFAFMQQHPFVFLSGVNEAQQPVVTQVPVMIRMEAGQIELCGHIMRNTDHHLAFMKNAEALAVFSGQHCYVSASWYSNPRQGSTWNYMSVHARGQMEFLSEAELRELLRETTSHFEANPDSGANFADLPEAYVSHLVKAIVGFRIRVREIRNVFKLSQNRDEASYYSIIEQLKKRDYPSQQIAAEMEAFNPFKK